MTIPVKLGGTGAVSATSARANLGLGSVDNTSDVDKTRASNPIGAVLANKADLVSGKIPSSQMPFIAPIAGTSPGTFAAGNDSRFDTLAAKADLVNGKVPASQLPASASPTVDSISDASTTGKSVLRGTASQSRTAIGIDALYAATNVNPSDPNWAGQYTIYDKTCVKVGSPTEYAWPGGGIYGTVSSVTGALRVPAAADSSILPGTNIPSIIIAAGVMGLVETLSNQNVGVGVFGMARMGRSGSRAWGANFVVGNKLEAQGGTSFHGQMNGVEVDCGWWQPPGPTNGGSNMIGIWVPAEFYGGRPDGSAAAFQIGRYAEYGWKHCIVSDHGGADTFAQIGMVNPTSFGGASGSQPLHFISASDTNQYHHGYVQQGPDGSFIIQPDFYAGAGSFVVANSDLSQQSTIHPSRGFSGPAATFGTLSVVGGAVVNGTITTSQVATGSMIFMGKAVELSGAGSIPPTHKALIIAA